MTPTPTGRGDWRAQFKTVKDIVDGLESYHGAMTYPDMVRRLRELSEAVDRLGEDVAAAYTEGQAQEREACAKAAAECVDPTGDGVPGPLFVVGWNHAAEVIARAIRARGAEGPPASGETVGERKAVRVAVMSCGCEYVLGANARPPSRCFNGHDGSVLVAVRYTHDGEAAGGQTGGWQPIETAPDAAYVLVFLPNAGLRVGIKTTVHGIPCWWAGRETVYPTHWMPLPAPPAQE